MVYIYIYIDRTDATPFSALHASGNSVVVGGPCLRWKWPQKYRNHIAFKGLDIDETKILQRQQSSFKALSVFKALIRCALT